MARLQVLWPPSRRSLQPSGTLSESLSWGAIPLPFAITSFLPRSGQEVKRGEAPPRPPPTVPYQELKVRTEG